MSRPTLTAAERATLRPYLRTQETFDSLTDAGAYALALLVGLRARPAPSPAAARAAARREAPPRGRLRAEVQPMTFAEAVAARKLQKFEADLRAACLVDVDGRDWQPSDLPGYAWCLLTFELPLVLVDAEKAARWRTESAL